MNVFAIRTKTFQLSIIYLNLFYIQSTIYWLFGCQKFYFHISALRKYLFNELREILESHYEIRNGTETADFLFYSQSSVKLMMLLFLGMKINYCNDIFNLKNSNLSISIQMLKTVDIIVKGSVIFLRVYSYFERTPTLNIRVNRVLFSFQ